MVQILSPRPLSKSTVRSDPLQNVPGLSPWAKAHSNRSPQSLAVGLDIAIVDSHSAIHESQCCGRQE
jgi:hypothetical protein